MRWGELDPYNHVNHAVYSSYLEHARVAALEHLDRGLDDLQGDGIQIVVVRSDVRFLASATAGDTLVISSRVAEVRGASMTWEQEIRRGDTTIVQATITAAAVNHSGRPTRIPADLRAALLGLS